ncbi:MAG: peptide chain release factor N(5)-glutamine methyltransferase [Planctomycetes bacterium]|nr:peptide chain release factor N(5)-glutamine methyltransferase [Planctomycetota bacterium]
MSDPAQGGGHTVLSVLRGAEAWLQRRSVEAPRRSAELLLGKVLGLGRLDLYLAHDRPLDDAERAAMRALVARRGNGEPVAYLLGSWGFRGLELEVAPAVLIPRPETELLVDHALCHAPQGGRVLDLGTGSGAIAIAIACERPDLRIVATDQSRNALAVAAGNVARHGVGERVELRAGDWWQAVATSSTFDVVVSNPPYIDPQAPHGIAADVAAHEPPLALYSAAGDVVSCYRAIAAGLAQHLVAGGWFVAETGVGASSPALALLRQQPFLTDAQLLPDPAGIDRFLLARRV